MTDSGDRSSPTTAGVEAARVAAPLRSLLTDPGFLRIWIVGALVGTIRWLEVLAVGVYTYQATGSPFIVAIMLFVRMVPTMLLGAFAGVIADRVNRRHLMMVGLVLMCLVSLSLAALAINDRLVIWHIALGAVLSGIFWSGEFPVRRTMLGEIAGLGRLSAAMGLDSATNNFTRMLGPLLGGALLTTLGLGGAYALGVLLYAVAFISMSSLSFQENPSTESASVGVLTSISEGFAYIRTNRLIAGTLVITVFVNLFGFSYVSMLPVIGEQQLGLGAVAIGVLMSVEGCGALLGSLCVAAWVRSRYFTAIYMSGSALYLMMILAFSLSPWYSAAVVFLFAGGLGIAFFGSMQSTLIFFTALPRMRTRVMGVLVACIGAGPIGVLHVGLLAEWLGASRAVTIIAVEGLIAIAVAACIWPELRRAPVLPTELGK
ncbi:MAG: MFS transporter [Gammaproteobacteria bacterium]|nr:MFS transporter [Gammaproteobacteria bacterium]MDX2460234.1 MFS transporter [Gammaproteobacteria bacterium]